ncbi:RNA dependent RNA polymerase-domain-containing protein [Cladochytrium replicatum]|nr:RNA dependent RNA polymerase-domain-containing protein [Cladochytrium replicatum]
MENVVWCLNCKTPIGSTELFCMFRQNGTALHLLLKPAMNLQPPPSIKAVEITDPRKKKKKRRGWKDILCVDFNWKVGAVTDVNGPNREITWSFSYDSVGIGSEVKKAGINSYGQRGSNFGLELRDDLNFFGDQPRPNERYAPPALCRPEPRKLDREFLGWLSNSGFTPRSYQVEMFLRALAQDSLIFLPTGTGKTLVACMLLKVLCAANPRRNALFVVDRLPLVYQQADYIRKITNLVVYEFCSETRSDARMQKAFPPTGPDSKAHVVVITAGSLYALLSSGGAVITEASAIIFDEAHHAVKTHNYAKILSEYVHMSAHGPAVFGLTASPSTTKIYEMFKLPVISPRETLAEMKEAVTAHPLEYVPFEYSHEENEFKALLATHFDDVCTFIETILPEVRAMLEQRSLNALPDRSTPAPLWRLAEGRYFLDENDSRETDTEFLTSIARHAFQLYEFSDTSEILGPQYGLEQLREYLHRLPRGQNKQFQERINRFREVVDDHIERGSFSGILSAKTKKLVEVLDETLANLKKKETEFRGIVFVKMRATAHLLAKMLSEIESTAILHPRSIVGRNGFDGMTWNDEQRPIIKNFAKGYIRLLVATSVLEEGLDIPSCNFVIHFDPPPAITSFLQSRGRARAKDARFLVLATGNDMDRVDKIRSKESEMENNVRLYQDTDRFLPSELRNLIQEVSQLSNDNPSGRKLEDDRGLQGSQHLSVEIYVPPDFNHEDIRKLFSLARMTADQISFSDPLCMVLLTGSDDRSPLEQYLQILGNPDVQEHLEYRSLWMRLVSSKSYKEKESFGTLKLTSLHRGYLFEHSIFVKSPWRRGYGCPHLINEGPDAIRVGWSDEEVWEFPISSLEEVIVLSPHKEQVAVYITTNYAPLVYAGSESDFRSRKIPERGDLPLVFAFNFDIADMESVREYFDKMACFKLFDAIIGVEDESEPTSYFGELSAEVKAAICRLWSRYTFLPTYVPHDVYEMLLLSSHPPATLVQIIEKIKLSPLEDLEYTFEVALSNDPPQVVPLPDLYFQAQKYLVTPSRVTYAGQELIMESRVDRCFGASNFVLVKFVDESGEDLDVGNDALADRMMDVLRNGFSLVSPFGPGPKEVFRFIGVSNSARKSASGWFSSTIDPQVVNNGLGDFSNSHDNKCKLLARLGLSFASSFPTIEIPRPWLLRDRLLPDIMRGKHNFSDGVGVIDRKYLETVTAKMGLKNVPSALQIRVAGFKGVLAAATPPADQAVCFRDSMMKFDSNYEKLEVLNYSRDLPLYLNRQLVTILTALGVPADVFMELQRLHLDNLLKALRSGEELAAARSILQNFGFNIRTLQESGIAVYTEPFFAHLLQTFYKAELGNVIKGRVFVESGRNLIGVVDETSTLKHGEVLIRVSESEEWVTGPVLVYRSPATHPGDVRILSAKSGINLPESLKIMKYVVVFPAQGPRPHPDECANGDLDGDLYGCIWDSTIVNQVEEWGMGYPPLEASRGSDEKKELEDLAEAYVETLKADRILGQIARAHLALCDVRDKGALDPDAVELARLHTLQVDFAKTGISVQMPKNLAPSEYPHFMQDRIRNSYVSRKTLGEMYDAANGFTDVIMVKGLKPRVSSSRTLQTYISEDGTFQKAAKRIYDYFKTVLKSALESFPVDDEAQLLLGCTIGTEQKILHGTLEKGRKAYVAIRRRCLEMFEDELHNLRQKAGDDASIHLASACYSLAVDEKSWDYPSGFPWIFVEHLCRVRSLNLITQNNMNGVDIEQHSFAQKIGQHCVDKLKSLEILADYFARDVVRREIETQIRGPESSMEFLMFGSSAIPGISSDSSDIDLCLMIRKDGRLREVSEEERILRLRKIREALASDDGDDAVVLKETASVPVITYRPINESLRRCGADIVCDPTGVMKARLLQAFIRKYPTSLHPALICLVRWARACGLIGSSPTDGYFPCFWFCFTVIQHWIKCGLISDIPGLYDHCRESAFSDFEIDPHMEQPNVDQVGELVLAVIDRIHETIRLEKDFVIADPFNSGRPQVKLSEAQVRNLLNLVNVMKHNLALSGGDLSTCFFDQTTKMQEKIVRIPQPIAVDAHDLDEIIKYYGNLLLRRAGVSEKDCKIRSLTDAFASDSIWREPRIVFSVVGLPHVIESVIHVARLLSEELLRAGGFGRSGTTYVTGSGLLLFEGALGDQDTVGFKRRLEMKAARHTQLPAHDVQLISPVLGTKEWLDSIAASRFMRHFYNQCSLLATVDPQGYVRQPTYVKALDAFGRAFSVSQLTLRFGRFYVVNLPKSLAYGALKSSSIANLEEALVSQQRKRHSLKLRSDRPIDEISAEKWDGEGGFKGTESGAQESNIVDPGASEKWHDEHNETE